MQLLIDLPLHLHLIRIIQLSEFPIQPPRDHLTIAEPQQHHFDLPQHQRQARLFALMDLLPRAGRREEPMHHQTPPQQTPKATQVTMETLTTDLRCRTSAP